MTPGLALILSAVGFFALILGVLGLVALIGWTGLVVGIPVAGVATYYMVDRLMTRVIEG